MTAPEGSADCLFCKIVNGDVPADVVHESATTLAFRDVSPQAPTHVLVIPKRHVPNLAALASEAPEDLLEVVRTMAVVAEQQGLVSGYRAVANTGPDAQQSVDHAHLHVLGGRGMEWPPG